jgi:hypothetical protein
MNISIAILVVLACAMASCRSVGGSTVDSSDYLVTFTVAPGLQQYFVKPLRAESDGSSDIVFLDCTIRHGEQAPDSAVINMSIISTDLLKSIDSCIITSGAVRLKNRSSIHLFSERQGSEFLSRFSLGVPAATLLAVFANPDWSITVASGGKNRTFTLSSAATEAVAEVDQQVFSLLR